MEQILTEFYSFLIDIKQMKENTVTSYKRDIDAFVLFAYEKKQHTCSEICSEFENYLSYLHLSNRSASTISRNIASLRCLFRYLVARNLLNADPSKGKKYEKAVTSAAKQSDLLTTDEIDRLITCSKTDDVKGYRDCAILETLYATGLKVSEFLNICLSDLHLEEGYLTVTTDESTRYVPLYKGATTAIRKYLKQGRKHLLGTQKNDFLFLNKNGAPLSRQGLWKILKTYAREANIKKELTPHLFRQSMAMHLVENGAELNVVQELLGHKNITLTKAYVKNFKPKIVNTYKKYHPKSQT